LSNYFERQLLGFNAMQKYVINAFLLFAVVFCSPPNMFSQESPWQSFTNMRNVKAITSGAQGVWAATTGGALFWDTARGRFTKFTNTEGLSQNETATIGRDHRGRIWIAQASGRIDVFDPEQEAFSRVDDYRGYRIFDLLAQGDSMYIALDIGVSFYHVGSNEVKETYKNLGPRFPRSIAVNALFIDGRQLWAGTNNGIARTHLDLPNLLAPESWFNYTTQEGLLSNAIRGLTKFNQTIVAATSNGVAAFDGQRWVDISGNIGSRDIRDILVTIEANQSVLYAVTPVGLYRSETAGSWGLVGTRISNLTSVVIDDDNTLWVSTSDIGLYEFDRANQSWKLREPDGPSTNNYSSLALDDAGNLWCTSSAPSFHVFDGERWYNYDAKNFPSLQRFFDGFRHLITLSNGQRWMGTWGAGIYVTDEVPSDVSLLAQIDVTSGLLSTSAPSNPNFAVIRFLKADDQGNIWMCNFNALNSNAIVVRTLADQWLHFSTNDGLRDREVTVLEIEKTISFDRIWIGSENSGVSVLDYSGTLNDKSDDDWRGELDLDDGLLSTKITAIAQDREGYMWIGTDKGLNYWFGGQVSSRFFLISDDIRAIGIDPGNNKWIGTSAGISVLSRDNFLSLEAQRDYTIENSPLVSNIVSCFTFNPNTGDVWIGTTNGLSRLRTAVTAPKQDLSQLSGYPNPFILDEQSGSCSDGGFRITNLAERSAVKIFNIAGELIRSFSVEEVPGAQICWNGRDASENLVPSGIYFFVAFVEDTGASAVGKVAVIRR
jgi:ligand-binding sensor domain-containing protein